MISRNKITLRIITGTLIGVVPVLILAAIILTRASQASLRSAYQANASAGLGHAVAEEEHDLLQYAEVWIGNPSFKTALEASVSYGDSTSLEARAKETMDAGALNSVRFYDASGTAQVKADKDDVASMGLEQIAATVAKSGKAFSATRPTPRGLVAIAAVPVSLDGKIVGVVTLANLFDATELERIGQSVNGRVALLRGDKVLVVGDAALENFHVNADLVQSAISAQKSEQALVELGGGASFVTYVPIAGTGTGETAVCAAIFTDATAYKSAQQSSITIWVITSLVLIVMASGVAVFVGGRIGASVQRAIVTLDKTAVDATLAAAQIHDASKVLADGSSEQAASLEETSASLEEMAAMTKRNAESAGQAKELSNQARIAADHGTAAMKEMQQAMDDIKASSDGIAKIIKSIDEIAFQTNLLALNAAVEAARAGEAGAGFAVVADEVRSLAQRSAQSAKDTAEKIEEAIRKSEHGVSISNKVGEALGQILDRSSKVDVLVAEIATASQEQSQGITQVNGAISQMDKITQANAASAEQSSGAAEELRAQSGNLKDAINALHQLVGGKSSVVAEGKVAKKSGADSRARQHDRNKERVSNTVS